MKIQYLYLYIFSSTCTCTRVLCLVLAPSLRFPYYMEQPPIGGCSCPKSPHLLPLYYHNASQGVLAVKHKNLKKKKLFTLQQTPLLWKLTMLHMHAVVLGPLNILSDNYNGPPTLSRARAKAYYYNFFLLFFPLRRIPPHSSSSLFRIQFNLLHNFLSFFFLFLLLFRLFNPPQS